MSLLTPEDLRSHGFSDFDAVGSPVFTDREGRVRPAKRFGFRSLDEAIVWLRGAPRPIYVMNPHPDIVREHAGKPGVTLRGSVGPLESA